VAPYPFFVHNNLKTTNFPQQMAKEHQKTLWSQTYMVGKFTNVIWGEDWDVEYFVDNLTKMSFGKVIHDMYEFNIEACAHVVGASIQLDSIQLSIKCH
jgi:hypothetical protein